MPPTDSSDGARRVVSEAPAKRLAQRDRRRQMVLFAAYFGVLPVTAPPINGRMTGIVGSGRGRAQQPNGKSAPSQLV